MSVTLALNYVSIYATIEITISYIHNSSEELAAYRRRATVFEKGTVATMTSALFCDECGAALPAQATSCAVCRPFKPGRVSYSLSVSFARGFGVAELPVAIGNRQL